jgi:hypothetical protein
MSESQKHPIDFSKVPDITTDDATFLSDIFQRFPRVADGYHQFTQLPARKRIPVAASILETQPRTGWIVRFPDLPTTFREVLSTHAEEYYGARH